MQKFANYMVDVMRFLSLPMTVRGIGTINEEATKTGKDPLALREAYGRVLYKELETLSTNTMECQCLDTFYLDEWMNEFVNLVSSTNIFEKFGSPQTSDKKEYNEAMSKYWLHVKSHCAKMIQEPPKNADTDMLMVIEHMERKIEWLRTGLVFEDKPKFLSTLPLPNKFLLSDILRLYSNEKMSLDKVVMDVCIIFLKERPVLTHLDQLVISVEPLAKMVVDQREAKKAKIDAYIRPWTNYTSAAFQMVEHNDDLVNEVSMRK